MKKYALIGHDIGESLSPSLHNAWMQEYGIDGIYELLDMKEFYLPFGYDGLNITAPFKKTLTGKPINTIKGNSYFNTDGNGFMAATKKFGYDFINKEVLIIGNGAVGQTIYSEIKIINPYVQQVAGREYIEIIASMVDNADIVINCTNIEGGYGDPNSKEYQYIDVNYKKSGINSFGYEMLKQQAALSFNIWHGINPLWLRHPTTIADTFQ